MYSIRTLLWVANLKSASRFNTLLSELCFEYFLQFGFSWCLSDFISWQWNACCSSHSYFMHSSYIYILYMYIHSSPAWLANLHFFLEFSSVIFYCCQHILGLFLLLGTSRCQLPLIFYFTTLFSYNFSTAFTQFSHFPMFVATRRWGQRPVFTTGKLNQTTYCIRTPYVCR